MRTLARLSAYILPHWWAFAATIALLGTITALRMAPARLTQLVIDEIIPAGDWKRLALVVLGVFASAMLLNGLMSAQTYLGQLLGSATQGAAAVSLPTAPIESIGRQLNAGAASRDQYQPLVNLRQQTLQSLNLACTF